VDEAKKLPKTAPDLQQICGISLKTELKQKRLRKLTDEPDHVYQQYKTKRKNNKKQYYFQINIMIKIYFLIILEDFVKIFKIKFHCSLNRAIKITLH